MISHILEFCEQRIVAKNYKLYFQHFLVVLYSIYTSNSLCAGSGPHGPPSSANAFLVIISIPLVFPYSEVFFNLVSTL